MATVRPRRSATSRPPRPLAVVATLAVLSLLASRRSLRAEGVDRAPATFLSGAASTAQLVATDGTDGGGDGAAPASTPGAVVRHLVCFRRGDRPPPPSAAEGRGRCCNELLNAKWTSKGERERCLERMATVPEVGFGEEGAADAIFPAFYWARDDLAGEDPSAALWAADPSGSGYRQSRHVKVRDDRGTRRLRDESGGVDAFSPFHLADFAWNGIGESVVKADERARSMLGRAEGSLSDEGGMHRLFRQRVHLSPMSLPEMDAGADHRATFNATVLLPITEGVFVDADDPLVVEYDDDSPAGASCRASMVEKTNVRVRSSSCEIQFAHPETIDIEQPSFASRQYVVAYRVSATLDLSLPEIASDRREEGLSVDIEYGTTLHLRYPSPLSTKVGDGKVPVVIQQPTLYAASASIVGEKGESRAVTYALRTTQPGTGEKPPNPIVVRVAAGIDSDCWFVTIATMSAALAGGFALMRSLDSASNWC